MSVGAQRHFDPLVPKALLHDMRGYRLQQERGRRVPKTLDKSRVSQRDLARRSNGRPLP
jgi:hypothetical protein